MNIARTIAVVTLLAFGSGCAETIARPSSIATSATPRGASSVDVHELPPDSPGLAPIESDTVTWNHYGDRPSRRGISGGAVAGIILGSVGAVALVGALVMLASAASRSGGGINFGHCCNWAGD